MKKTNLKNTHAALPIVAQAWGNKMGVKVVVGGNTAYTDGSTIVVPNVDASFGSLEPIWGYLLHEAQHVKETDFGVERKGAFFASLVNILEDVRIERAAIAQYPGAQKMLDACATYMVDQQHYAHVSAQDNAARIVGAFCLFYGQLAGVGQTFLQSFLNSATNALQAVTPDLEKPLVAILDEAIKQMRSTQDAADYSRKILELMKDQSQEQGNNTQQADDQSQPGDGDQQSNESDEASSEQSSGDNAGEQCEGEDGGETESGSGSSSGQQQDESTEGDSDTADSGSEGEGSDAGNQQGQDQQGGQQAADKPSDASQRQALEQALNAALNEVLQDARDALKADLLRQHDHSKLKPADEENAYQNATMGAARYRSAMTASAALRRQFAGLLQSDQQTADRRSRTGRLGSNLTRVAQGDTKVFVRRAERVETGAAVHVLVDRSSSMINTSGGTRSWLDVAIDAAATMFAAVETQPNTSCGLSFFDCAIVKAVKQGSRLATAKAALGVSATGSTNTGGAIVSVLSDLLNAKQDRKVLFVVTDGDPNCPEQLSEAIGLAEQFGVEVYGIGICMPSVKRHFSNSIVISDVKDLRNELMKLARKSL